MKTFPAPYNPCGAPHTPGYRFLGLGEILKEGDENCSIGRSVWYRTTNAGNAVGQDRTQFGYRRALNVDDPYAPPPDEWMRLGWDVMYPMNTGQKSVCQVWNVVDHCWSEVGMGPFHSDWYYRRPVPTGVEHSIASMSSNPCNEIPMTNVDDWIPFADEKPTNAQAKAGLWLWYGHRAEPFAELLKLANADVACCSIATHWKPGADAYPAGPKRKLPMPPKLDGKNETPYACCYHKGADVVVFGCARIAVNLLECVRAMADKSQPGNRGLSGITLDSGVPINLTEIKEILAYVDAVNKATR